MKKKTKRMVCVFLMIIMVLAINNQVLAQGDRGSSRADGYLEGTSVWATLNTEQQDRAIGSTNGYLGNAFYIVEIKFMYFDSNNPSLRTVYGGAGDTVSVTAAAIGTGTNLLSYGAESDHTIYSLNDLWYRHLLI